MKKPFAQEVKIHANGGRSMLGAKGLWRIQFNLA